MLKNKYRGERHVFMVLGLSYNLFRVLKEIFVFGFRGDEGDWLEWSVH